MSRENVEAVRRAFEELQAGLADDDLDGAFSSAAVSESLEWVPVPTFPGPSLYTGRVGFLEFMRAWTEDFEGFSASLERLIDAGDDRVVVFFRQGATGKGSGVPVELPMAAVCDLEDGRVTRVRNYLDRTEALEAVGLRE